MSHSGSLGASEYEELTERLLTTLATNASVRTIRIERGIAMQGRGTTNQIDVMWEYEDHDGPRCAVFECRSYSKNLTQGAVHAWRSVVDDISTTDRPCEGVMVTRTGYQTGARNLADTYGIIILELRSPTEKDLVGRVTRTGVTIRMRRPFVDAIKMEAVETFRNEPPEVLNTSLWLRFPDGSSRKAMDILLEGELAALDQPVGVPHEVRRTFDPPATLVIDDHPIAKIRAVTATVGEHELPPIVHSIDYEARLAWLLKDALNGSCVWFADDGEYWSTD